MMIFKENLKFNDYTYEGVIIINDIKVEIFITIDNKQDDTKKMISFANEFIEWFKKNHMQAKRYAASKLLEVKNDAWIKADEEIVNEDNFVNKMVLESISINNDKSATVFYQDNDLFWGHAIIVEIDNKFKFVDAGL